MATLAPTFPIQGRHVIPDRLPRLSQFDKCSNGCAHASTDFKCCQTGSFGSAISSVSSQETLVELEESSRVERKMGDTELSYYLPARESGVNDMYLHLGCSASPHLLEYERVRLVWAILRTRHPLLASKVEMHNYEDVKFVYIPPRSIENALDDAANNMEYRSQTKDALIDTYLNGPRTLSNDRVSYLVASFPDGPQLDEATTRCEFLICATHFLGDGMALHQFANDFFGLLGPCTTGQLTTLLGTEWNTRFGKLSDQESRANCLESRFPEVKGKLRQAVSQVDYRRHQERLIGGQTFPRRSGDARHTIVPTVAIDENRTRKTLKRCKERGVTISNALFAICNIAWAKTSNEKPDMPMLMYSALNLRPHLMANKALNDSYWFLAIGYFNVILPSFLPRSGSLSSTFWHRALLAKQQSTTAAKNPMAISRSREMAIERGLRARAWAREDDDKARGAWVAPALVSKKTGPPSSALIGLSLLGNLDGIYKHSAFPNIKLEALTTGSRQRAGGMLLFGYTFVGKLWISLGYDENGFDKDVVERFWGNVLQCMEDFLIS